jgi:predicted adenylyl cyclase CyaB
MKEIEAKIKLSQFNLKRVVEKLGEPEYFDQENIFYRSKSDNLRVRYEKNKIILTRKGEAEKSKYKKREEVEWEFSGTREELEKLMIERKYSRVFGYIKKRANYNHDGCVVSIDLLPNKDRYIEIESDSESDIERVVEFLGLDILPLEKRSYLEILNS